MKKSKLILKLNFNQKGIRTFYLFLGIIFCQKISAQNSNTNTPQTYAVIIGISNYENPGIDKLNYADQDAQKFSEYLKTKSGGSVADSNIILLKNKEANYIAMYNALDWLVNVAKEGDIVYFYFSGHGDMENNTIYKLGFLLSYNTPKNNYINNALRIEDLNNYANTLSIKTKAKVILITDACHSGKLAGNENKGTFLVGEQLRQVLNNEIRMSSCKPEELSAENIKWGGGRSVFSYYLLNGLMGLADKENDSKINVQEISNYLTSSLKNDLVLKSENHIQTPIVSGKDDFVLSKYNKNELEKTEIDHAKSNAFIEEEMQPLPKSVTASFFERLLPNLEKQFNFKLLNTIPTENIYSTMIEQINLGLENKEKILNHLKSNPDALKRFNKNLVEAIATRGDQIINLYLSGDESEIEKRRYYNSVDNDYAIYTTMFDVALKLTDAETPLAKILAIKKHYFKGVSLRIKIPLDTNKDSLIEQALLELKKAYLLDENTAYINNEIGILYKLRSQFDSSKICYEKAIAIAPTWAIPYSNLAGLLIKMNQSDLALENANKAIQLQNNFTNSYNNAGLIYESKSNWLLAEQNYRKSILLNDRHFLPFEQLGNVFTKTTNYKLAEGFYYESAIRKDGYNLEASDQDSDGIPNHIDNEASIRIEYCKLKSLIKENDILSYLMLAMQKFESNDYSESIKLFNKTLQIDEHNPLANYYLASIYYNQSNWSLAIYNFKLAQRFYQNDSSLNSYLWKMETNRNESNDCIHQKLFQYNYDLINIHFYLGEAYNNWNHYVEAEQEYRYILKINPKNKVANYKLWHLFIKTEQYYDAEMLLNHYAQIDNEGKKQLNAFYQKAIEKFPNVDEWYLKAANFLYHEAFNNPEYQDEIIKESNENPSGVPLSTAVDEITFRNKPNKIFKIPETNEISSPRIRAINYFMMADSLSKNFSESKNINRKIAELYLALNDKNNAILFYNKSIKLDDKNSSLRTTIVDLLNIQYQYADAMPYLDTLYNRNEIDFNKLFLLAKYKMLSGNYQEADTLLNKILQFPLLKETNIHQLQGQHFYLKADYRNALKHYLEVLKSQPKNEEILYVVSKIFLITNQRNQAFEYLKKSISAGFNYYWVLKNDLDWKAEKTSNEWIELTSKIAAKPLPKNLTKEKALLEASGIGLPERIKIQNR